MTIMNFQKAKFKTRSLPFDPFDYAFDGVYPGLAAALSPFGYAQGKLRRRGSRAGSGLRVQDIFCHFWFVAEELGKVVN